MGDNAAVAPSTGPAPSEAPADSAEMSAAERAYFESRGEDTSGLFPKDEPEPVAPAPEVKPEAKETAPAEAGDDAEPGEIEISADGTARDTKTGRFVPKSAYLRVRDEAKSYRDQASKYRDAAIQARERLALYAEAVGDTGKPKEPEPPKPEEDIFGFAQHMANKVQQLEAEMRGNAQQTQAQRAVEQDMRTFVSKEPGFVEAFGFLAAQVDAELTARGVADAATRQRMINEQARDVMIDSLRNGRSGAETIFSIAKARGWAPKPAVDPATEAAAKTAAEIAKINEAKAAGASLRSAGAPGVPDVLTAERISNMNDAEYSRTRTDYIAKHGRGAWNRLIGMG